MGSCCCCEETEPVVRPQLTNTDSTSEAPPAFRYISRIAMIDHCVMQAIYRVGNVNQIADDETSSFVKLRKIAEKEEGWQLVIKSLIYSVKMSHPLGATAVIIITNECPLPAVYTVSNIIKSFGLGRARALSSNIDSNNRHLERNTLVFLGCMAETFAGTNSNELLTADVMEYLFTFLKDDQNPDLILHSLITIDKFANTKVNKLILQAHFEDQHDYERLLELEVHSNSFDCIWRQIGFCARWLLDNRLFVPGRKLSYTTVDMSNKNVIIDCVNTNEYLKVSPDGLEARCDTNSFESIRCTFKVTKGCWYYEAVILTPGVMQIGWVTDDSTFNTNDGYGTGDDRFSLAYDGCRRIFWHNAISDSCEMLNPWGSGDILGCLIDFNKRETIFSINGKRMPARKDVFESETNMTICAAASLMSFQSVNFNFGARHFRYPPTDREFEAFNKHATLCDKDKEVIPRWLNFERFQLAQKPLNAEVDDALCTICFDNQPDAIISPCLHKGICRECAKRLLDCPMCRKRIWHVLVLPL